MGDVLRPGFRVLLLFLGLTLGSAPADGQTGPGSVSADSILATARVLSGETGLGPPSRMAARPSTSVYGEYLRDRLDALLRPLGGWAFFQTFDSGLPDTVSPPLRVQHGNVIGILPGTLGSARTFVLGAHWDATSERTALVDSTWSPLLADAPGADDNASGVAAILEALRVAAARAFRPQADVMVVFFDGEERQFLFDPESGRYKLTGGALLGSTHLADSLAGEDMEILGLVNADMVAYNPRQDSLVVVTNIGSRWLADQLLGIRDGSGTTGWTRDLLLARLVKGLAFSDHAPFWERGYDAVLLLEAEDVQGHAPHYHDPTDVVDAVYSRGGSQAAQAAGLLAGLLESWSWTAADSLPALLLTPEDILVQDSISVDLPRVEVGETVTVDVGFTNRGGTLDGPWELVLQLEDLDGNVIRSLGGDAGSGPVPAGARVKVRFPWLPAPGDRGAVRLTASLIAGGETHTAGRVFAVSGLPIEIPRAFVYPNPTRDPASAVVRYELTRGGSVRLGVLDLKGARIAERDETFDPKFPDDDVDPGLAEIPLARILNGVALSPGLYLLRIEVFDPVAGGSADVAISRFVVYR